MIIQAFVKAQGGQHHADDRRKDPDGVPAGTEGRHDLRLSGRNHPECLRRCASDRQ